VLGFMGNDVVFMENEAEPGVLQYSFV
jgi:hypothetical protein